MPEYPIEVRISGAWQPLAGHGCFTRKQAESYIATLGSKSLRIPETADADHRAAFETWRQA